MKREWKNEPGVLLFVFLAIGFYGLIAGWQYGVIFSAFVAAYARMNTWASVEDARNEIFGYQVPLEMEFGTLKKQIKVLEEHRQLLEYNVKLLRERVAALEPANPEESDE